MTNTTIINTIINNGIKSSPDHMGMGGQFYRHMWSGSHEDFIERLEALYDEGDNLYDSAYYGTGNAGDIGLVKTYEEGGYVYVYIIDNYGNYRASLFTHSVIAGEYPSYKEYKHRKYEEWRAEIRSRICG